MTRKLTYKELEHGIKALKKESTERKRVDEEPNRVFAALRSAPSGVIITDRKGSIKYANPGLLSMFEYKSEKEVTGKCVGELFATQEERSFADIEAVIDKSKGETEEFPVLRKDGTIFYVEVSTSSITDNEGHDLGRMASFVDITERKQIDCPLSGP